MKRKGLTVAQLRAQLEGLPASTLVQITIGTAGWRDATKLIHVRQSLAQTAGFDSEDDVFNISNGVSDGD